ncbi:aldo/keto reductase [Emydomyces testavorans]|uniref:Aldo/keto reductase n=1 Tax=Emydomyces testavorans TaxID=2070801 RepID=A0AAF0IJV3_9EURO|nr:aldo/keto reductase [Emydomyces testavorans]
MGKPETPLSSDLPPLIMGTATFNSQYNPDPYALPTTALVHRALSAGIRAFDTSPYYGPAESLLGRALSTSSVLHHHPRHTYRLLTKVGRIASSSFNYSPSWIRHSLARSLSRLNTPYLDVVYCHDVEFVSATDVLAAVTELRRLRDTQHTVRYIGISGYPVPVLCTLAEHILRETGEPLDAVMSYANFTVQNTTLASAGVARLRAARVDVVLNASPLGMGLLRRDGVPVGGMGDFHPAPEGLRNAVGVAGRWVEGRGERIEVVSIRYALEEWLREGAEVGSSALNMAAGQEAASTGLDARRKLGVSVMGVSTIEELDETLRVWRSIIDGLETSGDVEILERVISEHDVSETEKPSTSQGENLVSGLSAVSVARDGVSAREQSRLQRQQILSLVHEIRKILGPEWVDYTWPSPEKGFVNQPPPPGYDEDLKSDAI